jgi:hypothetical protein
MVWTVPKLSSIAAALVLTPLSEILVWGLEATVALVSPQEFSGFEL